METGEVFQSIEECAEKFSCCKETIYNAINGKSTKIGYHFCFEKDYDKNNNPWFGKSRFCDKKPIVRVVNTGEEFISIKQCAEKLGIKPEYISDCLRGKQKSYKGYTFIRL